MENEALIYAACLNHLAMLLESSQITEARHFFESKMVYLHKQCKDAFRIDSAKLKAFLIVRS